MVTTSSSHEAQAIAHNVPAEHYDRVVRLAQAIFATPIAVLNLVDRDSSFVVASVGFPLGEMPKEDSVCLVTVQYDDILEVRDLREDERFASLPAVAGPLRARFYAGVPVRGASGQNIGALCILDLVPRTLGRQEREMLADLGELLERELAVQAEIDLAGQVQQQMLPTAAPDLPGVEIAGRLQPLGGTGGDFFDWFVVKASDGAGSRLQIVLGDVMGTGLGASLIASEVRAVLRSHSGYTDVGDAVARTAAATRHDLEAVSRFSTLWVGRLDPATGVLDYVDAGHGLAIIVSPRGSRRLFQEYVPLGMPIEETWLHTSDALADDEVLVVVSDGVFDVFDGHLEEAEAMLQAVLEPGQTCRQIVDLIVDYATDHGAADDVTALAVRRVGDADAARR